MSANDQKHAELIKKYSQANIDEYVKTTTLTAELEEAIRSHIHLEFQAWGFYRKLAADCCRSNICLHGFSLFWKRAAGECIADALWLEGYLIKRGGRVKPLAIPAPAIEWAEDPIDPIQPVHEALKIEKALFEDCQRLCVLASKDRDVTTEAAISHRFLCKEMKHVKDLGDLLQQTVRVSKATGHSLYHLDKELRENNGLLPWGSLNHPDNEDCIIKETAEDLVEHKVPPF